MRVARPVRHISSAHPALGGGVTDKQPDSSREKLTDPFACLPQLGLTPGEGRAMLFGSPPPVRVGTLLGVPVALYDISRTNPHPIAYSFERPSQGRL
jgi:hypothetical protein